MRRGMRRPAMTVPERRHRRWLAAAALGACACLAPALTATATGTTSATSWGRPSRRTAGRPREDTRRQSATLNSQVTSLAGQISAVEARQGAARERLTDSGRRVAADKAAVGANAGAWSASHTFWRGNARSRPNSAISTSSRNSRLFAGRRFRRLSAATRRSAVPVPCEAAGAVDHRPHARGSDEGAGRVGSPGGTRANRRRSGEPNVDTDQRAGRDGRAARLA